MDSAAADSAISAAGRYIAFTSDSPDLVLGDTNGVYDTLVRDRQTGTTERISVDSAGAEQVDGGVVSWPDISTDGRFVAFGSIVGTSCGTKKACADHKYWPRMTLNDVQKTRETGGNRLRGRKNRVNELLGWHGSDTLYGGDEPDVLWADHIGTHQPSGQVNRLYGGGNDDYLYSARGMNILSGGPGNDAIKARYGHGTIDCGPGRDIVHLPKKRRSSWKFTGCEAFEYRSESAVGHGLKTPGWETRHLSWPAIVDSYGPPSGPRRPKRGRSRSVPNASSVAGPPLAATVGEAAWGSIGWVPVG